MGCWNEICEITRMPIVSGESCVMIDFKERPKRYERWSDMYIPFDVVRIVKGTYSDVGDLNEFDDSNYPGVECPLGEKGEYDAGKRQEYRMRPYFIRSDGVIPVYWRAFIKQSAWDMIVDHHKPTSDIHMYEDLGQEGDAIDRSNGDVKWIRLEFNEFVKRMFDKTVRMEQEIAETPDDRLRWFKEDNLKKQMEYLGYITSRTEYWEEFALVWSFMRHCHLGFDAMKFTGQSVNCKAYTLRNTMVNMELSKFVFNDSCGYDENEVETEDPEEDV